MNDALRAVALAGLALILAACTTRPNPDALESAALGSPAQATVVLFDKNGQPLARHRPEIGLRKRDILAISGGGSHGAFGAGFLAGWTKSGARPEFEVVTGISTGALMASFAFLGPRYDGDLARLYTETTNQDIFKFNGIAGLFGQSLFDTNPLKQTIEATVTEGFLDAVAREHARGRRLYVGTTDLDSGRLIVWNMGEIAARKDPARAVLYRDVLLASAAIPGAFAPVFLPAGPESDNRIAMHVDGGVKAPLLLRAFMLEGIGPKRVYLLVNGQMTLLQAGDLIEPRILPVAQKSINELLRGLLYKTTYQAYVTARNAGAGFNLAAIPDDAPPAIAPIEFKPEGMKALFDTGYRLGQAGRFAQEPPRLEQLERIGRAPRT